MQRQRRSASAAKAQTRAESELERIVAEVERRCGRAS